MGNPVARMDGNKGYRVFSETLEERAGRKM
jgi:hypothetical protein